jgi:potassium-dependent mechanosensitive channel
LVGTVKRIGARSSTVQTYQGSEVIVPNSNLISNQVINWTLSTPWRRVEVPVGIAYGTNPEQIIELLVQVAGSNPGVMRDPKPSAFFVGFGDSALNFELRFWAARQESWFQLKSDVTTSVARALGDAGIEIPFPQRDLHVRSIDGSVKDALTDSSIRGGTSDHASGSNPTQLTPPEPLHGEGDPE